MAMMENCGRPLSFCGVGWSADLSLSTPTMSEFWSFVLLANVTWLLFSLLLLLSLWPWKKMAGRLLRAARILLGTVEYCFSLMMGAWESVVVFSSSSSFLIVSCSNRLFFQEIEIN